MVAILSRGDELFVSNTNEMESNQPLINRPRNIPIYLWGKTILHPAYILFNP